jgi:cullin 1
MGESNIIHLEEGWKEMEVGIAKVKRLLEGAVEELSATSWMSSYTIIYNMCTQKPPYDYSEQLYSRYMHVFKEYIESSVMPELLLLPHLDEVMLKALMKRWNNHKLMVRWLSRFCNYLDRYYVMRHGLSNLRDVGLMSFRDNVFSNMKERAKQAVLIMIEKERDGGIIDRGLVKNILGIYIEVGLSGAHRMECYERDFEAAMLSESSLFYKRRASEWTQQFSCPEYMLKAEECLRLEEEQACSYLHVSTMAKLLEVVETEILAVPELELLHMEHSGCAAQLKDDRVGELTRMYRLFKRVDQGTVPIADIFKQHVLGEGMQLLKETSQAIDNTGHAGVETELKVDRSKHEQVYVRKLIDLHDKYVGYVKTCYSGASSFYKVLKEAFEAFCNKEVSESSSAEVLVAFCDNLLRKGGTEKLSDDAIEASLDAVVNLLVYINDKDLFAEFYRKRLARRLLFDNSSSDDRERGFMQRLKQQNGSQFTSKIEGMVTDIALAREKQGSFHSWLALSSTSVRVNFINVTVLTTGFWPSYKITDLVLPNEMADGVNAFKEFYDRDSKNRRLVWVYALGTVLMKANFKARAIELNISTIQAATLVQFNDNDELSFTEIKERLNIVEEDVGRVLHSLSCAKYNILVKEPNTKVVLATDKFRFNAGFTSKMTRIKVPVPPIDDKKKVVEDVDKDRRYSIDAAIVRTMKSRKTLQYQQLIMEVVQQLSCSFKADIKLIKKRIEDLISRDYIERDTEQQQLFRYLA